jgi:glutathione S-transferase
MKIYGDVRSGNCDKVRFTVDYLRLPYEWVEIDSVAGATRTPEFLAINSQGQVPVVQLADGRSRSVERDYSAYCRWVAFVAGRQLEQSQDR